MGYRYYAKVTFPTAAGRIPAVAAALAAADKPWYDIDEAHNEATVSISGGECSSGEIEITGVLEEHQVPYDHYHSDDCSGSPEPWTLYVRYDADGNSVETEVSTEAERDAFLCGQLLGLLDAGDIDGLRAALQNNIALGPPVMIDEIALEWQPPEDACRA